ncbi:MAG: polyribonucleotide nucleotidyltransferase, partial [Bacillales bacterium]|nr:polyribonucleotide nucleotidyltransferase [Bacillales bacterium]
REGRPTDHSILSAREIDRTLRPLFADGFRNEVQVVNYVLSVDQDSSAEVTAMIASSLALSISDIPFSGPIAGCEVGLINGQFIIDPSEEELNKSELHFTVAGTAEAINMVEGDAKEVSEEVVLEAIMYAHEHIKEVIKFENEIIKAVGKVKRDIELYTISSEIKKEVELLAKERLLKAVKIKEKLVRYGTIDAVNEEVEALFEERTYKDDKAKKLVLRQVHDVFHDIVKDEVRRLITVEKIRPDGRGIEEVRPLNCQIDLLPRVHGSALFTRGETQVLSIVTLGPIGDVQLLDNISNEETKRFIHHYNFPPFSVGEVGRMGNPGRREIGHGALGERALKQVIPSEDSFPYTIRVVSEVLESNGSSSQGSICASSMALMAAGVPISRAVSGIAMGLVTNGPIEEGNPYTILTDIQGMEDHLGDMDFKVAGTSKGICAIQMDIKILGINKDIIQKSLAQAKKGREHIRNTMEEVISKPRSDVGKYALKLETFSIQVDKIRDVIGPGGKIINEIIADCDNVKIDIEQTGRVVVYHVNREAINKAVARIKGIVKVAEVGEKYLGTVVRVESYGAFVNLFSDTDGLLHVSQMDWKRVEQASDFCKIGDKIEVIVTEIKQGKVSLSHKDLIPRPKKEVKIEE